MEGFMIRTGFYDKCGDLPATQVFLRVRLYELKAHEHAAVNCRHHGFCATLSLDQGVDDLAG